MSKKKVYELVQNVKVKVPVRFRVSWDGDDDSGYEILSAEVDSSDLSLEDVEKSMHYNETYGIKCKLVWGECEEVRERCEE